jgi:hypothetical protein
VEGTESRDFRAIMTVKKFLIMYGKRKVHYRLHNSTLLLPIFSYVALIQALLAYVEITLQSIRQC